MGTDLKALTTDIRIASVLEKLLTGKATTISRACELAEVPRSTFYSLVGQGAADQELAALKQNIMAEVLGQAMSAMPEILQGIISDASDEKATARDRQDARRTLLQYLSKLSAAVGEPRPDEDAAAWLKERGASFSPVQVNVHVHKGEEPPTIEIEGSPIDGAPK